MAVQSPFGSPNGLLGSPRLEPFGSEQPMDGVPRCGYGHPVTKCAAPQKGLKRTEGWSYHNHPRSIVIYNALWWFNMIYAWYIWTYHHIHYRYCILLQRILCGHWVNAKPAARQKTKAVAGFTDWPYLCHLLVRHPATWVSLALLWTLPMGYSVCLSLQC